VCRKTAWGLFFLLILISSGRGSGGRAQTDNSFYYTETGHWVKDNFLVHYTRVPNQAALYGLPITDAFFDRRLGTQVQYFEKARFVLNPYSLSPDQIDETPLGYLLKKPGIEVEYKPGLDSCRLFIQTGFEVCFEFLEFFNHYGGVAQFGYPISNLERLDGRMIVQHFQMARFEWHPELPAGSRVVLGDLGKEYFEKNHEDPRLLFPNLEGARLLPVSDLSVKAFPGEAVLSLDGVQTLYVRVEDQSRNPVSNAKINFTVFMPDGTTVHHSMAPTDSSGYTSAAFQFHSPGPGVIRIEIFVRFAEFESQTRTGFYIWGE
jgi:hypothetical protein